MKGSKAIEDLFGIRVIQCSHILNVDVHANPKVENIPLEKGNLFLGGVGSFKQPIINGYRITSVLSILDEMMIKRYMIKEKVQHLRIQKYKWIDLEDDIDQKISPYFQSTHQFIRESLKNHNVLVHCQMGVSRSASILIAFLMREYRVRYKEAFEMVSEKRKFISPNQGFVQELLEYEKVLFE